MRKFLSIVIITLLTTVVYAQDLKFGNPEGFKIEKFDGKTMIFSMKMTVENTNSKGFGVTIKKGKVYKDGKFAGTFKLLKKIKLKKKPKDNFHVRGKIEFAEEVTLKDGLKTLLGGGKSNIKLEGIIKATWFILWKKFPFTYETSLNLGSYLK